MSEVQIGALVGVSLAIALGVITERIGRALERVLRGY